MDSPLGSVEVAALTQGVTFLYNQAGELLKRRREAKDRAAVDARKQQEAVQNSRPQDQARPHVTRSSPLGPEGLPALEPPDGVFASPSANHAVPIPAVLDELSTSLLDARRSLDAYLPGGEPLRPTTTGALHAVDRLRRLVEQIYGVQLTFAGEWRQSAKEQWAPVNRIQEGGITAGGSIEVKGDIAGRDIHKY
jgi:hypothetical protein